MDFIFTGIIKFYDLFNLFIRSILTRIILSATWTFESGVLFRGPLYRRSFGGRVRVGRNSHFGPWVNIDCASNAELTIGRSVAINFGATIVCRERIVIENHVMIGELVSIRDNDHVFTDIDVAISEQGYKCGAVVVLEGAWIGRGATIMPGVTIGRGAVVGANAVVTKSVPDLSIAAGVPARVVGHRKKKLLKTSPPLE